MHPACTPRAPPVHPHRALPRAPLTAALLALAALAGCGVSPDGPPAPRPAPGLTLVPGPRGLDVAGSGGLEIGFGRHERGVLESAARVAGARPRPVSCGGGRNAAAIGELTLVFENRRFLGWRTADGAAGVGCGR